MKMDTECRWGAAAAAAGVTNGRGRVVQQLPELRLTHASLSSSNVLVSML